MGSPEEDKCPVDHKSREAWLKQARAASDSAASQNPTSLPPQHPPVSSSSSDAESCPVDHNARQVWLEQAKNARPQISTPPTSTIATAATQQSSPSSSSSTSWSSYIPRIPYITTSPTSQNQPPTSSSSSSPSDQPLDTAREISTIPRSSRPDSTSSHLANNEQETGASASGNWIYPSERMFFDAMKRKGHDPQAPDMRTVVPIHNAVNERAWKEIKEWERPWIAGTSCAEPRLHSFSGLSTKLSPKARVNTWLGYSAPFDRHDWVVDRCGVEVEYIIDFYAGRPNPNAGGVPSFYLDVRPKLNSWEAVKTRAFRAVGLS